MADYKDVYIGKNTPITVENLNQMAQNDVYNYDKLRVAPRGILAWKQRTTDVTINQSAGFASANLELNFTCETDRFLRIGFTTMAVSTNVLPYTMEVGFYIGDAKVGSFTHSQGLGSTISNSMYYEVWVSGIAAGTHKLKLIGTRTGAGTHKFEAAATTPTQMWIEDCGGV